MPVAYMTHRLRPRLDQLRAIVRLLGYTPLPPPDPATPYGEACARDLSRVSTCSVEAFPNTYGHPCVEVYWTADDSRLSVFHPSSVSQEDVNKAIADSWTM